MKLCMGCMEQINDSVRTCPYCGFDETTDRQEAYYLHPGTVIAGKYIVGRAIKYNGFIISYIGWDAEYNRKIIVQEYMPNDFATRTEDDSDITIYSGDAMEEYKVGLTTFLNEGNALEKLQNVSGIAAVYDCCTENSTGYLITEYLEGKSLKEILDTGKQYSLQEAENMLSPLCSSLSDLHQAGVMHYEIAPENIIITMSGQVKLINFGASRYINSSGSQSLAVLLKPGYAPEEQYRSQGEKGPWSDVYSLGAVLYHMITGVVPEDAVERTIKDTLKEPSKQGVSISKSAENAIMNSLNVYKKDRTKSIQEFQKELKSSKVKRIIVKRKGSTWMLWGKAIVAVLAVVLFAGAAFALKASRPGKVTEIENENIVKMPTIDYYDEKTTPEELEKDYGFKKNNIKIIYTYNQDAADQGNDDTEKNNDVEKYKVISMNPIEGTEIDKSELDKTKITIEVVSSQYATFKNKKVEEDICNVPKKDAISYLKKEYGLPKKNISSKETDKWEGNKGNVLSFQLKPEGSEDKMKIEETKLELEISKGTKEDNTIILPNLVGMSYDTFNNELFRYKDNNKNKIPHTQRWAVGSDWNYNNGDIVAMSIASGTEYHTWDNKEKLFIYVKKDMDLDSLRKDNVESELETYKIIAKRGKDTYSDTVAKGNLIYDSKKLKSGESVTYHVSLGKKPKPEPKPEPTPTPKPENNNTNSSQQGTTSNEDSSPKKEDNKKDDKSDNSGDVTELGKNSNTNNQEDDFVSLP